MSAEQMTTARLSHISLAVSDPAAVAAFYAENVGMAPEEESEDGTIRLGWGAGFHALELREGDGLHHFGLSLPGERELSALEEQLAANDIQVERQKCDDRHPEAVLVRDPDGQLIELHGPVDRSGEHAADPGRRPVRIHHVTLASPDVMTQVDFYERILGFRLSDRMGESFAWLRCNREHHTVAVVEADAVGLDHYCFEIDSWASLKTWCDELAVRDVPVSWGPGRHGPGNNLFIMFDDPAGTHIELSCEMERYWDEAAHYEPRVWLPENKTINLWGPTPAWRDRVTT